MPRQGAIFAVLIAVIGIGVGGYLWFTREVPQEQPASIPPVASPEVPAGTLGPEAAAVELPSLDESDEQFRAMAQGLSFDPQVGAALLSDELVRRVVAAVDNIARGESPRRQLPFLEPSEEFHAIEEEDRIVVDASSYGRYDGVTEALRTLDLDASVRLYRQFEPLFDEAYRELGYPGGDFDSALDAAIEQLVSTPIPRGDVELEAAVLRYEFKDRELEELNPAQKHLLRMGAANAAKVQFTLRELRAFLAESQGVPD